MQHQRTGLACVVMEIADGESATQVRRVEGSVWAGEWHRTQERICDRESDCTRSPSRMCLPAMATAMPMGDRALVVCAALTRPQFLAVHSFAWGQARAASPTPHSVLHCVRMRCGHCACGRVLRPHLA